MASFDDRFGRTGSAFEGRAVAAPRKATARAVAAAVPRPDPRPKDVTAKRSPKAGFQLASASATSLPLGYASADPTADSGLIGSLKDLLPKNPNNPEPMGDVDLGRTAIYDISSHTVYLPNGRRLEAHSGLGSHMDDPRSVHMRNTGVTPPNVYKLKMRESLFHGVRAIRLIPTDESKMHGRSGMLAHTYMLGPSGQSNGCVSFSDYPAFLEAYQRGDITRLVVVERLTNAPSPKTAADWLHNTLKDIFSRS
jgi:hypothetical protein